MSRNAYGVNENGDGEVRLSDEVHACLTCGGGKPGQSYPCVRVRGGCDALNTGSITAFHIMQDPINSEDVAPCLSAGSPFGQASVGVMVSNAVALDCRNHAASEVSGTLQAKSNGGQSLNYINPICVATAQANAEITTDGIAPTITAAAGMSGNNMPHLCEEYTVRRLTPLECERLQGFPDYWTDIGAWEDESGKPHKDSADSARYKALGNSIALPPWVYVLQRLSLCCGGDTTMASLFDGIGGFPLIWESLNGSGSCLWASEIEDFPIAVTKRHFNEVQRNE